MRFALPAGIDLAQAALCSNASVAVQIEAMAGALVAIVTTLEPATATLVPRTLVGAGKLVGDDAGNDGRGNSADHPTGTSVPAPAAAHDTAASSRADVASWFGAALGELEMALRSRFGGGSRKQEWLGGNRSGSVGDRSRDAGCTSIGRSERAQRQHRKRCQSSHFEPSEEIVVCVFEKTLPGPRRGRIDTGQRRDGREMDLHGVLIDRSHGCRQRGLSRLATSCCWQCCAGQSARKSRDANHNSAWPRSQVAR